MCFLQHRHYNVENCICKYNLQDIGIYFITNFNRYGEPLHWTAVSNSTTSQSRFSRMMPGQARMALITAAMSAEEKTEDPATSTLAPAAIESAAVLGLMPPSTSM